VRGLHGRWQDDSDGSLFRVAGLVERVASEYPLGGCGCTLMVDALATVQALGVHLDGRVTGTVEEVIIDRERTDAIRSSPAAFHQFVGQQVLEGQVTGALFAFVLTLDAIGSPPIPALLLRRAHCISDGEVVGWIDKLVRTLAGLGRPVNRAPPMGTAGSGDYSIPRGTRCKTKGSGISACQQWPRSSCSQLPCRPGAVWYSAIFVTCSRCLAIVLSPRAFSLRYLHRVGC
jgi:hypothetical protein